MRLPRLIKEIRLCLWLSQDWVAREANMSRSAYQRLESGKVEHKRETYARVMAVMMYTARMRREVFNG